MVDASLGEGEEFEGLYHSELSKIKGIVFKKMVTNQNERNKLAKNLMTFHFLPIISENQVQ